MAWAVVYTPKAPKQLRAMEQQTADRIETFFATRVANSGDPYRLSEPLMGKFSGQRRFRVGECRIICDLFREQLIVSVVKVAHRKEVYV